MLEKSVDINKKGFDEHIIRFYINYINKKIIRKKIEIAKRTKFKKLRFVEKIKINFEGIERKIQEEINKAIEKAAKDLEFEVTVEPQEIADTKLDDKKEQDREIKIRYASEEKFKVDYAEIFSYLNTRPNLVNYEYEFTEKKDAEDSELTPQKIAKINQIKRVEKVLYDRDLKYENPEGVDPKLYEQFRLYSNTFEGFVMNQFCYNLAFFS